MAAPSPSSRLNPIAGPLLGLAIVLGLFISLFLIRGGLGQFASLGNLRVLVYSDTITAVAALGMLIVIISGGIDLSTGSVVALVTVVTMQVYRLVHAETGSQTLASLGAVTSGVLAGGTCGFCNGLIITRLKVTPFVTTLGMFSIARGLAVWLSQSHTVNFAVGTRPAWVDAFAEVNYDYTYFTPSFWTMVVLAIAIVVMLRRTVLGRYCYAIGSNERAAQLCGVPVERSKIWLYTISGLLTGWAGVLMFAQLGSGEHSSAQQLELHVIAAVVIGGASLTGGQGTVSGTLLGVLILAILRNAVNNFNVPIEVQLILIGVIIILNL